MLEMQPFQRFQQVCSLADCGCLWWMMTPYASQLWSRCCVNARIRVSEAAFVLVCPLHHQLVYDSQLTGWHPGLATVTTASNGSSALQLIRDRPVEFDLVLSDVYMPGMYCQSLRERVTTTLFAASPLAAVQSTCTQECPTSVLACGRR